MKTKILTLALLLGIMGYAYATTPAHLEVKKESSTSFKITYYGGERKTVHISIVDSFGETLAKRKVENVIEFKMPVSFEGKEAGKYLVIVSDGNNTMKQEIILSEEPEIYSNFTKLNHEQYLLTMYTGSDKSVTIKILDESDHVVLSKREMVDGQKALLFNTKYVKGNPSFVVETNVQ